jgi:hypothetical protein
MLNLTFRAQSRVAGAAISEHEQMAVGARHSWTKLQFVCTSEQADSAVIGSAKRRDERPLTDDHLGNVNGDPKPTATNVGFSAVTFLRIMRILALAAPDFANARAGTCQCFLTVTRK